MKKRISLIKKYITKSPNFKNSKFTNAQGTNKEKNKNPRKAFYAFAGVLFWFCVQPQAERLNLF